MRLPTVVLALAIFAFILGQQARANMVITPTFAANIMSDPNAATIEATINSAIAVYQSNFADPITVHITFQEGGGLGSSSTFFFNIPYTQYLAQLTLDAKTSDDATALAHLPTAMQFSTFFGTTDISVKTANERAIGIANGTNPDGTITLNTTMMNLSRTGPQDPAKYDLMAVASHEIDEVLGLGSALPTPPSGNPFPEDLFRYNNSGGRSYTATSGAVANFSIDGTTILAPFHNTNDGADYGDWENSGPAKVQDAFGTPGAQPNLGVELRALDVIGYDSIPEPGTALLLGAALVVLWGLNYTRVSRKARLPR
jgi:hypothetical protein